LINDLPIFWFFNSIVINTQQTNAADDDAGDNAIDIWPIYEIISEV